MSDHDEIEPLESWTRDDAIEADCEAAEEGGRRGITDAGIQPHTRPDTNAADYHAVPRGNVVADSPTYPCRECGTPLPEPHQMCGHCYQFLET